MMPFLAKLRDCHALVELEYFRQLGRETSSRQCHRKVKLSFSDSPKLKGRILPIIAHLTEPLNGEKIGNLNNHFLRAIGVFHFIDRKPDALQVVHSWVRNYCFERRRFFLASRECEVKSCDAHKLQTCRSGWNDFKIKYYVIFVGFCVALDSTR
jgi:hypothetical protein